MQNSLIQSALQAFADGLQQKVTQSTEQPSDWIQQHFYVPDPRDPVTGKLANRPGPILLAQHQCDIINEALSKKPDGTLKYSTIVYSAPKKSGKSAITSAVILYMAAHNPNSFLACLANDGKQANDRLYGPIYTCLRLHRQLNGLLKDETPNLGQVILNNNTKIEAVPVDAAGEAGSQPLGTFWSELWGYETPNKRRMWCYDDQTQALTKTGWKKYTELTLEDELATLNPNSKQMEWHNPQSINIFDCDEDIYVCDSRDISIAVTSGHRFYGKTGDNGHNNDDHIYVVDDIIKYNKFGFRAASNTACISTTDISHVIIPRTKRLAEYKMELVPYLRLLGWFISEGCVGYRKRKDGSLYYTEVNIAQKTGPYITVLEEDLKNTGLKYSKNKDGFQINDVRLAHHFSCFGKSPDKYIPRWVIDLPENFLWEFIKAYHLGDGGKTETTWTFFTVSEQLKDNLAEIGVRFGTRVRISKDEKKKPHHHDKYRVVFSIKGGKHRYARKEKWKKKHYTGKVWCPSVTNGIFMVRRNETYYFGGNTELTIPPTLYGKAIRWVESYAGYSGVSELLEQLYHTGFTNAEPHPNFLHLQGRDGPVVRINERAGMFVYWDTEHRMPWQSAEYYAEQAETMPATEFDRIHNNMWVSPTDSFIREEWWDACETDALPVLESSTTPVVVGIDMAETGDCAALVAVTRDPYQPESQVAIRAVKIFNPKKLGGIIDQEKDVRPVIEEWAKKWNVVCFVYDPREMSKLAQDLTRDGIGWFRKFGQTQPRAVADKALYDMVVSRQIHWSRSTTLGDIGFPGDTQSDTLRKHIVLAGANTTNESRRLIKLSTTNKIDAAVALSQASQIVMELAVGNDEMNPDKLITMYQKRQITEEEFTRRVRSINPKLMERMAHDTRKHQTIRS